MTVYNFSAGPAALPKSVMEQAQAELLNFKGHGTSVMEMSHRGAPFIDVAERAEASLRKLMDIPSNYKVLFLQGGGRGQFFSVPLNLAKRGNRCSHLVTGLWSKTALEESAKYMQADLVANSLQVNDVWQVPTQDTWRKSENAAYFHYCPNETVEGVEINWVPKFSNTPVVADMSSNILSKKIKVNDFGIIYASAQKNIGPSGLAVVIVRDDLIGLERDDTPAIFNYREQSAKGSMYNTPPTFSWYLAGLVFDWLVDQGGLTVIEQRNRHKSELLYECIDQSDFFHNRVHTDNRSKMNVVFHLADEILNDAFLAEANKRGLLALKGHRAVGGMRASIYNAMPLDGVQALVSFMKDFEKLHA